MMDSNNKDDWTHIEVNREASNMYVQSSEYMDGILYVTRLEYDKDGRLARKTMVRADLISA